MITIRKYRVQDIVPAMEIWNEVVRDGIAFPQDEELTEQNADSFFNNQSYTGIAEDNSTGELVGLYILHPNNVGQPCFASVRAFGLYATWKDSSRFSYEGWTL